MAAAAAYGDFAARLRNAPFSTASEDGSPISAMMGLPFTATAGGAERDMWVTHRDFPEAFKNAPDNAAWGDLVTGLGLMDMGPFGTIICPTRYTLQINFRWMERNYEASILEENPEETAARLLRSNIKSYSARLRRRGIAAQMEVGYMYTPDGIQHWFYMTQAFADSIKMTIVADVVWSLFNAYKSGQMYEKQFGYVTVDRDGMIDREVYWYGMAHLNPDTLTAWDTEAKRWAAANNVRPDVYVTEPLGAQLLDGGNFFEEHKWYVFTGPDGASARMPGEAARLQINGTPVYVTPPFSPYDSADATPTTVKLSIKGSYFLMLNAEMADPHKRTIRDRSIMFHNEDTDNDEEFGIVKAITNANVWDLETGEVDDGPIKKWRDDNTKSFVYAFKYGDADGRQHLEACKFFGHQEDAALDLRAIYSVAESALAKLSAQDRDNINRLFETFREIRGSPTADFRPFATVGTDATSVKRAWAGLTAAKIRENSLNASFPGLEALATKDPDVRAQVASFKYMARELVGIFGGHCHLLDGSLCPIFWRDYTNDRVACTLWHLIVDEETAPCYFVRPATTDPGVAGSADNVFSDWDAVEKAYVRDPQIGAALTGTGRNAAGEILDALRGAARRQLQESQDTATADLSPDAQKAIKAPYLFVEILRVAMVDAEVFAKVIEAAVTNADNEEETANAQAYLRNLTPAQALQVLQRCTDVLQNVGKDGDLRVERIREFAVRVAAVPGGAVAKPLPSPFVATALSCGSALFADSLRMAHPGEQFMQVYAAAERPTTPKDFYQAYHKSKPTTYSDKYPSENFNEDAQIRALSGQSSTRDDNDWWTGAVPSTAANPRLEAFAAVDRAPIVRGGDNDTTSIRHAQWFANDVHWNASPSLVNNWNRILATTDVARRVSMAAFLFTRVSKHALLKMADALHVDIPVNALLARPNHVHAMGGFVLTQSGPDTGETFWTNPIFQQEQSATLMMFEAHYALHLKCVIKRPENIIRYDNAYFAGYRGGGGHRVFTMEDIEAWYNNQFFPELYIKGTPSIMVMLLPVTERVFKPYIDITGAFATQAHQGDADREPMHYSSAYYYREKYMLAHMPSQKLGWMSYYPRPTPNRLLCAGRYYGMDETGKFNPEKATRNRGHLKDEQPGIGVLRSGQMIRQHRHPLTTAIRPY